MNAREQCPVVSFDELHGIRFRLVCTLPAGHEGLHLANAGYDTEEQA